MKPQKPLLGFSLAMLATAMWGSLPIAVQQVIKVVDPQTLVWARFVVASASLLVLLALAKKLPNLTVCSRKEIALIGLGILGLSGNFFLIAASLHYISPTTTQVLWQVAPFSMIFLGVFLFKEPLGVCQKVGFALLIIGLLAFFNDKFSEILQLNTYAMGLLISILGSLIWVCYGIAQKLLLKRFNSQQILLIIYFCCAIAFSVVATPSQIPQIDGAFFWSCFVYCCLNTIIAYGSYGEALNHWDTSKVSVVTTMIPIFTMIFSLIGHYFFPDTFDSLNMNSLSYIGALIVVAGAMIAAVGDKLFVQYRKRGKAHH